MTDNIITFPGAIKASQTKEVAEFGERFSKLMEQDPPDSCKTVGAYETIEVITVPRGVQPVPDIATAGKRNPRWGVVLSFSVLPDLDQVQLGTIMLPHSPSQFFAADDIDQLKERIFFEIEKGIGLAKLSAENPQAYQMYEMSVMQERISSMQQQEERQ